MAKATAIFDADDSRLQRAMQAIDRRLKRVQAQFAEIGQFAAKMLAAPAAAAAALGIGLKDAFDTGGRLADLSANTGIAVKDLMALEQEFKNAGKSGEDVGKVVAKMQNNLANGGADDVISQLGLNLEALKSQTPVDQFHAIGSAINGLEDPAEKTAAAMAVFGKEGASLLSMFASGGFGDAAAQVGEQAEILNRDAALFDDVGDKLALVGVKVRGFFVGVADKVAPVLKPLLDRFATLDLAKMGQEVGQIIAFLVQAFSDGRLGDILWTSFKLSLAKFGNGLVAVISAAGVGIWEVFKAAGNGLIGTLGILTSGDFWAGMGLALLAAGQGFIALLLAGFEKLFRLIEDVPVIGEYAQGAADTFGSGAADMTARASRNLAESGSNWKAIGERIWQGASESMASAVSAISGQYEKGANVFDTSGLQNHLNEQVGIVFGSMEKTRATALAQAPTMQPKAGDAAKMLNLGSRDTAVTALQKIGGAFGRGGGGRDPLLDQARSQTSILKEIRDRLPQPGATQKMVINAVYAAP